MLGSLRFRWSAALAAGSVIACFFNGAVLAQDKSGTRASREQHGRFLLEKNCGGCHAIDRTGDSQHKLAPPFRVLGQRYSIESLEEALGEGIMSGHPDMPEFQFEPSDVGAIIAYLKVLQVANRRRKQMRRLSHAHLPDADIACIPSSLVRFSFDYLL